MADTPATPLTPVKPNRVEVIYIYTCPHCGREVPIIAPTTPSMAHCDTCTKAFPITPVDAKAVQFFKLMQAGGPAGVDPDFL